MSPDLKYLKITTIMKKMLLVLLTVAVVFVLFSFTQRTNEKSLIMIRVYESCEKCDGVAKIVVSGDGAEKVTQLEGWEEKTPEANTNLELIRFNLRTYFDAGYKIASVASLVSGGQEITTYVLTRE